MRASLVSGLRLRLRLCGYRRFGALGTLRHVEAMSLSRILTIVAAVLGAGGTVWLARGSYSLEGSGVLGPVPGVSERNVRRHRQQQFGLGLIMVSFVVQGVSACLP